MPNTIFKKSNTGSTTYTAGDGLNLTGTEFSTDLKANSGLVHDSNELSMDLGASGITGTLALSDGGTGATTASAARNALGLNETLSNITDNGTAAHFTNLKVKTTSGHAEPMVLFENSGGDCGLRIHGQGGESYLEISNDDDTSNSWGIGMDDDVDLSIGWGANNTINKEHQFIISHSGTTKISAGKATGTNTAAGHLDLQAGRGTGNEAGGSIRFYSHDAGSSGTSSGTLSVVATIDKDGNLSLDGAINPTDKSTSRTNLELVKGISNTNVLACNSNVEDDDFLRIDGTSVEGRSVSEMKSDLGIHSAADHTATSDGSSTGQIAAGTTFVTVTSTLSSHIIKLPTPVVGLVIDIFETSSVGYDLQAHDGGTTVSINGGSSMGAKSSIPASQHLRCTCVHAEKWLVRSTHTDGSDLAIDPAA